MRKIGEGRIEDRQHTCQYDWPSDIFLQCGNKGIVFHEKRSYRTAFVEGFHASFGFLRGEGKTKNEAETDLWNKYQKFLKCPGHEYERRGYENGLGFCKNCDHSNSNAFEPTTRCTVCDKPTYYTNREDKWFCHEHQPKECVHCRMQKLTQEDPDSLIKVPSSHMTGDIKDKTYSWMCQEHFKFFHRDDHG